MKIKKLTIHGFKSFVDKTTFNFPSGTSAIIGPNGCGKSNIVDAIRWVLGEQNARHLRGSHMEDVIFTGSDTRKPVGMAEVVLTFSNERGAAGARFAAYPEIEISRRLYRSGESEYSINKVPSRLKDIVDLFTDTGIGTRAYSIIEQGQVGWLISAKPAERRVIFEEAAGINKFRLKKEAAMRRLEAARENLTRVSDITAEVKRQLNSLNRQAKKAERYKAYRDELRRIDLGLSKAEYASMAAKKAAATEALERVVEREAALAAQTSECEARTETLRLEHARAEDGFKAVRERVFNLEKLISDEEGRSALAAMRTEELGRAEERLTGEIAELEAARLGSVAELERIEEELAGLEGAIEESAAELEERAGELEETTRALAGRREELSEENAESMKCNSRLTEIKHSLKTALRDRDAVRERQALAYRQAEEIEAALLTKEQPLREIESSAAESARRTEEIEAELNAMKDALSGLEHESAAGAAALKALEAEYANARARLEAIEEMNSALDYLKDGARTIMQRRDGRGIIGLVSDVIEINPGYEKAVEAVLGERLEYVIVESHKEGVEAIDFLKAGLGGRSSFVSVKDLRPGPSPVMAQAGAVQYPGARELIDEIVVKDGYRSIIDCLVGDTLVVDDLDAALEIWKRNGIYRTLVTLEGDVIDPQGVLTGGAGTGDGTGDEQRGVLLRKNEIRDLKAFTEQLASRIATSEAAARETAAAIDRTRADMEECRERLHSAGIERVNLEGEMKIRSAEKVRLTSALAEARAEAEEAASNEAGIETLMASLAAERDGLEGGFNEREARIRSLADKISAATEARERVAGEVTELKVSLAQANERRGSLRRRQGELRRGIEEAAARAGAKTEEIERGRTETGERTAEIEAAKARIEELLSEMDGIKREEVAGAERLAEMDERIKACEAELKQLKASLAGTAEQKGRLTIEVKELELEMAGLKDRIAERYGCDIAAFTPDSTDPEVEGMDAPDNAELDHRRTELREKIAALGEVSLSALEEFRDLEGRHSFLVEQQDDLNNSVESLMSAVSRINRTTREKFKKAFNEINEQFKSTFPRFFNGGRAELRLTDEKDVLEAGIEIVAQPPGKRLQNLTLLSGGEKALTATALIFAIFLIKPSPFCLLDEVDAPLDDANIDRFNLFVRDLSEQSQILLITHNKKTMEMSDALYGITMEEPGVSKTITVRF